MTDEEAQLTKLLEAYEAALAESIRIHSAASHGWVEARLLKARAALISFLLTNVPCHGHAQYELRTEGLP